MYKEGETSMNIFEFLGLPSTHRKLTNKVTQLVKHWDEVPESRKTGKRLVGQIKKDGVCTLVVVLNGVVRIFSRTGKQFTNTHDLIRRIELMGLSDGVFMGEMVCDGISLEQLSGVVNPNRNKPLDDDRLTVPFNLDIHLFDLVEIEAFEKGASSKSYRTRWLNVHNHIRDHKHPDAVGIYVLPFKELSGPEELETYFKSAVDAGEEGIVIRDLDADWEAGHKGWRVMKLVRGVDYDLRCIGYEEGTGKYKGKVANLIFKWKGEETIKCMLGKGWTHADAEEMFRYATFNLDVGLPEHTHKDSPVGKIFQVYALEESSKGKLRLPKVGEKRFDKDESDV